MPRILIPIDGSDNSKRALTHLINNRKALEPLELHILNVQPPIVSGAVTLFIDKDTIERFHHDEGTHALASARQMLDEAGIVYSVHIQIGNVADRVAAFAKDHQCDQIIMGTRGLGTSSGFWLGSVTTKTLHLIDIPVTVVK